MAYIEEANELMTDATGQSIATAIGNMSATSVGNLAALQTTDKTSLVGAVNEVKSGLANINNALHIFVGSLVMTPQLDGKLSIPFSTVGVSIRPSSVFVTLQSKQGFAIYDFDQSANDYIEILAFERELEGGAYTDTFIPIIANEPVRLCVLVYT